MNSVELISSQFHWLRPYWLLALIPAVVVGFALWRQRRKAHQWQQVIAPELLPFLIDGESTRAHRWQIWMIVIGWIIATLALAGPTWEKRPMPVQKNQNALVVILDLSPSMLTEDIKPSRLVRARLKIADILRERKDGLTALVVYAGDAHVVTPLTDDTATINSLLTSLHPNIMPLPGSNTEAAIELALRLLADAGIARGDLLLLTDGIVEQAHDSIERQLADNIRLSILGVGGDTPAPIPTGKGGFLRDNSNAIITTRLESTSLRQLAQSTGGRYQNISSSNNDIERLLNLPAPVNEQSRELEREFDSWYDNGHWLVFLLLPLLLYCFRRGAVVVLLLAPALSLYSPESSALSWKDLWLTPDQQAQKTLQDGDAASAAEQFETPQWKGSAQYRAGDYDAAAQSFAQSDSAQAHYNRGNALAKAGKLDDAIAAYDEALKRDPDLEDAKANRQLIEDLKKQQENNQQDQNQQDQNDRNENKEDQNNENQQGQDGQDQNQDQQKSDDQQNGEDSSDNSQQQNSSASADNNESNDSEQNYPESNKPEDKNQNGQSSSEQNAEQNEQQSDEQNAEQQSSELTDEQAEELQAAMEESDLTDEQKQSLEQWLRRVPDDPGGLLRNKFRYQHQQQLQERHRNLWPTPENEANQRW